MLSRGFYPCKTTRIQSGVVSTEFFIKEGLSDRMLHARSSLRREFRDRYDGSTFLPSDRRTFSGKRPRTRNFPTLKTDLFFRTRVRGPPSKRSRDPSHGPVGSVSTTERRVCVLVPRTRPGVSGRPPSPPLVGHRSGRSRGRRTPTVPETDVSFESLTPLPSSRVRGWVEGVGSHSGPWKWDLPLPKLSGISPSPVDTVLSQTRGLKVESRVTGKGASSDSRVTKRPPP